MKKIGFDRWGTNIGQAYNNGKYANQRFRKEDMRPYYTLSALWEDGGYVYVNNPLIERRVKSILSSN